MPIAAEAARPALLGEVPSSDGAAHRMRHVPPAHTVTRGTHRSPAGERAIFHACSHCSGALCDKQDCSVNVYDTGGYLLCHDDVIGTRHHRGTRVLGGTRLYSAVLGCTRGHLCAARCHDERTSSHRVVATCGMQLATLRTVNRRATRANRRQRVMLQRSARCCNIGWQARAGCRTLSTSSTKSGRPQRHEEADPLTILRTQNTPQPLQWRC